jgi:iron complex transport system substrate-binding protein
MKTNTLTLLEIAIVLCSVFLVALPGIAAEQTMQKVSASTITTASEDDYVLGVYGNANEDDTIDMRDLTYVKLIFFGKKPETELADAKYDGKINPLDFIQIKLIIVGKEKEITIVDYIGRPDYGITEPVTVHKPVERIVVLMAPSAEALRGINAADKIVGVGTHIKDEEVFFPKLSKLPIIGTWMGPGLDYEAILNLNPDLFMVFRKGSRYVDEDKLPGVTVIALSLQDPSVFAENVKKLGYILDKKEETEDYINWHEGWINEIKSKTEGLSEDEKPRVFHWSFFQIGGNYKTITKACRIDEMNDIAGGKSIADDLELEGSWPTVDPEWVMERNPDIIVAQAYSNYIPGGYGTDDPSGMAAARDDILNRPELSKVTAVKTGNVYVMAFLDIATGGSGCLIGTAYMAKWFHPDLFEDLDPEAIHQEYLTRFQGFDYDLDKHGVFVYPPLED